MIVALSATAERDLERLGDWIASDNPERAVSFVQELQARCLALAEFPKRFPLVPRYERLGVRHFVHVHYLVFYRVEAKQVTVIHILHGASDYLELLPRN